MKYLGINLTKYIQELYEQDYKTVMKDIKQELNEWRDIPCSYTVGVNIVKISVLPNLIYRCKAVQIKLSASYSERRKPRNSQHNVKEAKSED